MYETYVRLRDARGLTDYKVSKDTGISTATLSSWKTGRYVPKVDKLKVLADYFGVTLDVLTQSNEQPS